MRSRLILKAFSAVLIFITKSSAEERNQIPLIALWAPLVPGAIKRCRSLSRSAREAFSQRRFLADKDQEFRSRKVYA
jgi:hypothetical protein